MCRNSYFIETALKIAEESEHKQKMCALVTKGKRILSVGLNKNKTHPKQLSYLKNGSNVYAFSTHAELSAISKLSRSQLKGCSIIVVRRRANGKQGLAKPCDGCRNIIIKAGITKIIYTTNGFNMSYSVEEL